jgi:hypothetical protein
MSELLKIVLTSSLTVLGGIIVFVTGQIVVKFLIEPFHNYKKLVGEIADSLVYYANVGPVVHDLYLQQLEDAVELENPRSEMTEKRLKMIIERDWERMDLAQNVLRQQASQLMGATNTIPLYKLWAFLRILPKQEEIIKASSNLIGFSNSTGSFRDRDIGKRQKDIAKYLHIKVLIKRFGE